MRYAALVVMCLYAIIGMTSANAGAIADSISYQGQLTDASDNPVPDGPKDLILSIWTDSVGGTMLHSEVVIATTSKGLFSTCIGCGGSTFPDIFNGQTLFLQTQLTGQPPISPRTRLRAVPYSMSASSVHGEATNGAAKGRGIISVKSASGSGSMTNGLILLDADSDGDGVAEASDSSGVTEGAAGRRLQVHNLGSSGEDGVEVTAQSAGRRLAVNNIGSSGNDGVEIQMLVNPSKGDVKITASQNGQSLRCSSSADSAAATTLLEADLDGDGVMDNTSVDSVDASGVSRRLRAGGLGIGSSGQDGVEVQMLANPSKGDVKITASQNGQSLRCSSSADHTSATTLLEADSDDDGNPEASASLSGYTPAGLITGIARQDLIVDPDDDGTPDGGIESIVTPTTSSVAINTKGTGADKGRMIITTTPDSAGTDLTYEFTNSLLMPALMKAKEKANRTKCSNNLRYQSPVATNDGELAVDSAGSGLTMTADSDGDGVPEAKIIGRITSGGFTGGPGTVTLQLADVDDDGVPEGEISQTVLPTTSSVAIKTKGTGADKDRVISSTTDTSKAVTVHSADLDGDGLADRVIREQCDDDDASITVARGTSEIKIRHKGWDGTIKGRMAIEQGGAIQVDFAGDGVGFVSQRFGVGVLTPTHPIEHSSGAHLTAGGVWTNASDENLKENFQPVDGAELLEKIELLPISEWNYRSESDEVTHIGPTAQDFQRVFGVGENDKSISTIDPSGIALAAIKELNKQNRELKSENENLKKQLEALSRKVEKLAAGE